MDKVLYLILIVLLNSCFCTYNITVKKDGSAHVEINDWTESEEEVFDESIAGEMFYADMDEFENSPIVSNYARIENNGFYKITYDVGNVDSLHRYLWPVTETHKDSTQTKFKFKDNMLIITHKLEENGPNEVTMYSEFLPIKVVMDFEMEIKSFKSDIEGTSQTNNFQIELNSNLRELSYGEGTKTIEVSF